MLNIDGVMPLEHYYIHFVLVIKIDGVMLLDGVMPLEHHYISFALVINSRDAYRFKIDIDGAAQWLPALTSALQFIGYILLLSCLFTCWIAPVDS